MIDQLIGQQLDGVRKIREWANLELTPILIDGKGADTGGPNSLPHGKMVWTPALKLGDAATFTFTGAVRKPHDTWDDCYAFERLTTSPLSAEYFGMQLDLAHPPSTLNNKRLTEFELDYCEAGWSYNMAWRLNNSADKGPSWQMFNMKTQSWEAVSGLPTPAPQPGKFISVWAHFIVDRVAQVCIHDSIKIDGVFYSVNVRHAAVKRFSSTTNQLVHALQLDSDGKGTPLTVMVKNYHVRCL